MTTMLKTITEEDVNIAFALIDVNQKNIIDFDDFRKFYVTINKLPNDAGKSEIQPYPLIKKMSSRQDNESDSRKFDERENHSHTSLDKRKVSSPVHTREKS